MSFKILDVAADGRLRQVDALSSLGEAYERLGDYAKAKTWCEQALCILREIGERVEEGWALISATSSWL